MGTKSNILMSNGNMKAHGRIVYSLTQCASCVNVGNALEGLGVEVYILALLRRLNNLLGMGMRISDASYSIGR